MNLFYFILIDVLFHIYVEYFISILMLVGMANICIICGLIQDLRSES